MYFNKFSICINPKFQRKLTLIENERSVDIYLYMAYNPKVECANKIKYSIDYVKYIICERKYNDALKYNRALQNASIEALVTKNLRKILP